MDNNINYVPQIDYTSRDYTSIREDLISVIPQIAPTWTSRDPADFGMAMVELFAYLGDLFSFYIDRAANEGFITTASQRDSVLNIAYMLGYTPTGVTAATVSVTFTNATAGAITLPAGSQIATTTVVNGLSTQIVFETNSAVTVPAKVGSVNGTATVTATEGSTVSSENLGTSNGSPSQSFKLSRTGVIQGSVIITIAGVNYAYVSNLIDSYTFDSVFTTINDGEGNTYVLFGDGVNGRIPPGGQTILATYRVGVGAQGNLPASSITQVLGSYAVSVTNAAAATGGADEESTDSIRFNSPQSLRALTRAVSLRDYAYLAIGVTGVRQAVADSSSFSSVILYVVPFGDAGVTISGGLPTTTASSTFTALATTLQSYFVDKTAPNVTLTILPPTYVAVDFEMTVYVLPQYKQSEVQSKVMTAIRDLVSIDTSSFADIIPAQYLLSAASSVMGVDYATVGYLRKQSSLQSFTISAWSRTSNVVTATTSATHNITVGQAIRVTNSTNGTVDVDTTLATVTAVGGATTFSYVDVGANGTAITPTGTANVKVITTDPIVCATNEIPYEGTYSLTFSGGIS